MNFRKQSFVLGCVYLLFSSCSQQKPLTKTVTGLKFIGEYSLPYNLQFKGTTVGGLSSIDYSPKEKICYLVCDDRSDINPVRCYKIKIELSSKGIDSIKLIDAVSLLMPDGEPFHNRKQRTYGVPDPESMRYNRHTKTLVWGSEGERSHKNNQWVLTDAAIYLSKPNGLFLDSLALPQNMHMSGEEKGPRNNGVFEGLAFSPDFEWLYVSVEEPLYEDGPRAAFPDTSGIVRIIKYDLASKKPVAQYAYQIDPVVQEAISDGTFSVNGITDILTVNDHQLLVTERSYSTGRLGNNIRVYSVDLSDAEDVGTVSSFSQASPKQALQKKLLFNMDRLKRLIDNVEGATFGPLLPNGKQSLIFVTDNNFSSSQKTQFLLFEVE